MEVLIDQIKPSPYQPRLAFDLEDIRGGVVKALKENHLPNLVVRKVKDYYELIDGERRWRIAKQEGFKTVPCQIVDVDDETARRMIWRVNTARKEYTPKEKAHHFKKLQSMELSLRSIARECDQERHSVLAHLNTWRLTEYYQNLVWNSSLLSVGHIQELESYFDEEKSGLINPPSPIIDWLNQIIDHKWTVLELREALKPEREKAEKRRIALAKDVVAPEVKLESPEDFERAAEALRKEAERRKTPEQKAEQKRREAIAQARKSLSAIKKKIDGAEKIIGVSVFRKRLNELEKSLVENPHEVRKQLIALGKEVTKAKKQHQMKIEEEKRRRREEEERRRIREEMKQKLEEEAKAKAKEELLKDREFIKEFIAKEYPFMRKTLGIEDLKEELMQRLITSVPEEKRERAEKIFEEEFRSLRKRLKMFPEKSARMEPKFDRLRQLEEEGVFLTTLWDIGERAGYAGRGDFHGNCPPQVVESCVLHKTKKGELVVDPMAGSGTALDVCKLLGRNCIAYDLKPPKWRNDIIRNDSRKIPLENNSADMVFLHPPYWDMVYYTSVNERLPDLSRAETLDEYLSMLGQVLQECYRILKSEKHLCILLGDRIKNGRFIPLCRKTANLAEEIGFTDCGYAIKFTKGSTSLVVKGKTIYAELAYTENLPKINHDLVMFFKKA